MGKVPIASYHECPYCKKKYSSANGVNKHRLKQHGNRRRNPRELYADTPGKQKKINAKYYNRVRLGPKVRSVGTQTDPLEASEFLL